MDKEQIMANYGNEKLKFSRYYKYTFYFKGMASDGTNILAGVGGDGDSIYKLEVIPDIEETLNGLDADFCYLKKDGKDVANFDDRW